MTNNPVNQKFQTSPTPSKPEYDHDLIMSTPDFQLEPDELEYKKQQLSSERSRKGLCVANGCPMPGGIHLGDGWACRFHYRMSDRKQWGAVTHRIKTYEHRLLAILNASARRSLPVGETPETVAELESIISTNKPRRSQPQPQSAPVGMQKAGGLAGMVAESMQK